MAQSLGHSFAGPQTARNKRRGLGPSPVGPLEAVPPPARARRRGKARLCVLARGAGDGTRVTVLRMARQQPLEARSVGAGTPNPGSGPAFPGASGGGGGGAQVGPRW